MRFAAALEGGESIRLSWYGGFSIPHCGWTGSSHWTSVSPPVAWVTSVVRQPELGELELGELQDQRVANSTVGHRNQQV